MTFTQAILDASSAGIPFEAAQVAAAIDACLSCAQACTSDADADLIEDDVDTLRTSIALDQDCADICSATARVLSRPANWDHFVVDRLLQACSRVCLTCAEECARHADHHPHCAICEKACRACLQACSDLLTADALEELAGA